MRWRGTSWKCLPGGKHLGFEVPVEPQDRYVYVWWKALFVCVGGARCKRECNCLVYLVVFRP